MLHRGDNGVLRQLAAALQGLHRRHNQRLHHVGILGVALLVPSPAGIGNQVRVGAQGHAHAHGQVLLTGDLRQLGHQLLVPGGGQGQVMGRHRGTGNVGQAMHGVHGHQHRHAQAGALRVLLDDVHGVGGRFHAVQFADQQHANAFLIAPLLQVGGDFPVRPGQEGGMLHLGVLLPHGHLAHQVRGAGVGILPPVLVYVQLAIAVQVDELIPVHLHDGLHMGVQGGLLVALLLGKGGANRQAAREGHSRRQGQAPAP